MHGESVIVERSIKFTRSTLYNNNRITYAYTNNIDTVIGNEEETCSSSVGRNKKKKSKKT